MRRTIFGALALMLAAAAPAAAQGMPATHDMMMQPDAHMALMHRQELGLTADQVQRLSALDSSWVQTMRAHCAAVHAAGGPNAQTHATMHPQMEAAMQAARTQLAAVLTGDQLARLDSLHAAHHDQMMHDMAGMQHDSAMAAMHTAMAGGSAPSCGTAGACGGDAACHDCCAHMGCCDAPAAATKP